MIYVWYDRSVLPTHNRKDKIISRGATRKIMIPRNLNPTVLMKSIEYIPYWIIWDEEYEQLLTQIVARPKIQICGSLAASHTSLILNLLFLNPILLTETCFSKLILSSSVKKSARTGVSGTFHIIATPTSIVIIPSTKNMVLHPLNLVLVMCWNPYDMRPPSIIAPPVPRFQRA